MKKVLIIIHLPRSSPRIEGLVRYLPEFDWLPIILTGAAGQDANIPARVIETPYRDALGYLGRLLRLDPAIDPRQQLKSRFRIARKKSFIDNLLTLGGEVINYPCPDKNWRPFALKAGKELLQKEKIDALISSSPPVISHLIARQLKEAYKTPWLADLRDLWSQNAYYIYSPLRRRLDKRLEVKTFADADILTTISEPMAEALRTMHQGKSVETITPGFDPANVNIPPAKLTAKFSITYTGSIYPDKRDPVKLFSALRDLISNRAMNPDDIEVRFYGAGLEWLNKEAERYGLTSIVKQFRVIPMAVALEKQRESQLLLFLDWDDPKERGVYTGKIFDYLGSRRPILATGGVAGNVIDRLLSETKAGVHAPSVEDTKKALKQLYDEYKTNGVVTYRVEESAINKYSHREMAGKFAEILTKITS